MNETKASGVEIGARFTQTAGAKLENIVRQARRQ